MKVFLLMKTELDDIKDHNKKLKQSIKNLGDITVRSGLSDFKVNLLKAIKYGLDKQQAFDAIGVNPQRLGMEVSRQTATGVQQAVQASYAQTEMYFIQHSDNLMPRVHQMRTDLSQFYHLVQIHFYLHQ